MSLPKFLLLLAALALSACETPLQRPDGDFDASVAQPGFPKGEHPLLLFDEGHHNFHTSDGLYAPFARLAANDGFEVKPLRATITREALQGARILVVAGARGEDDTNETPAFTATEVAAIDGWVRTGGALLLIADHYPFGPAVSGLAGRFGVTLAPGMVEDSVYSEKPADDRSRLLFSRQNGLLADGPITNGINRVVSFTGTSLRGPAEATALLRLSPAAYDLQPVVTVKKDGTDSRVSITYESPKSAAGAAQALALTAGTGRVVVLGEAAMLSAQLNRDGSKVGMNYNPGNKQLALNLLHWLAAKI